MQNQRTDNNNFKRRDVELMVQCQPEFKKRWSGVEPQYLQCENDKRIWVVHWINISDKVAGKMLDTWVLCVLWKDKHSRAHGKIYTKPHMRYHDLPNYTSLKSADGEIRLIAQVECSVEKIQI